MSTTAAALPTRSDPPNKTSITLGHALNEGLHQAMRDDEHVVLLGEDIGTLGGVFRVTDGLAADFGDRVVDTPLAESGIVGTAIGLALRGYRPVCEIQFDGFAYPAFNQIVSQLAKMHARSRGFLRLPVTIRIPVGGGIRAVEHHSESNEAYFCHTAGLRVVACGHPQDAYSMLRAAIACDDPVIFYEPKRRYWDRAEIELGGPVDHSTLDHARVIRQGTDVTLVAYGPTVALALNAAEVAADEGRSLEVLDVRSLSPLDTAELCRSASKTGRMVVVHEAPVNVGLGAEIAATIMQQCFYDLKAPVERVGGYNVPYPPARAERTISRISTEFSTQSTAFVCREPRGALLREDTMPATKVFRLPDLGEGLTEAEIITWRVGSGAPVALNDVIVEVETAKAVVELPSPYAGKVAEILCRAGETIVVGTPIISIAVEDEAEGPTSANVRASAEPTAPKIAAGEPQPLARQPVLVGYISPHAQTARRPRKGPAAAAARMVTPTHRHNASPLVRKLARELGVDLSGMTPASPSGKATREDVYRMADEQGAVSGAAAPSQEGVIRTPIRGVRKHTADAVVSSAFTAPHVTEWVTADVTRSVKLLARARADSKFTNVRLTLLCLVIKATLTAIAWHPEINAKWDTTAGEIVQYPDVNLGIAAATPRGLVVPNIPAAQRLSACEIALALADLTSEARAGKTPPERLRNGTFTITNIGVFGVDGGTPILNPGETAILCLGQVRRIPWEHNGRIRLREVTTIAMSFDHRLVDGELGSLVLRDVARCLERPELMALQ